MFWENHSESSVEGQSGMETVQGATAVIQVLQRLTLFFYI